MMEIELETQNWGVTYVCPKCSGTYPSSEFCFQWSKPLWCKPCGREQTLRRYEKEQPDPEFYGLVHAIPNLKHEREVRNARSRRRYSRRFRNLTTEDRSVSVERRRAIRNDPCYYCGGAAQPIEVEHFFPLAKGGNDFWVNLVASCPDCNDEKGTKCGTWMLLRKGYAYE